MPLTRRARVTVTPMSQHEPSPDDLDALVLDERFIRGGRPEPSAEERAAKAQRIARANDELRARGEISDGSGKPVYHAKAKRNRIIAISAIVAVAIVVVVLLVV